MTTRNGTPTYCTWKAMRERCNSPKHKAYPSYGGRGIQVCERWNDYLKFLADMGERPEGKTLDRINNDANYSPENCRWATRKEQGRNRRTAKLITFAGHTKSLTEWCELLGVQYDRTNQRMLRQGMSFVEAVTTPLNGCMRQ